MTVPIDGNYIYEVWAKWNGDGESGGTAYYGFYTVTASEKTVETTPEPPGTMLMPIGRNPDATKA